MNWGQCVVATLSFLASSVGGFAAEPTNHEFFEKKIRPVLSSRCYGCHSSVTKVAKSGLTLDTREGIRRGGVSGPAVVPKEPQNSPLLAALKHIGTVKMPPGSKPLSAEVVADFETWIKDGAEDPRDGVLPPAPPPYDLNKARQHWSYRPIDDPAVPTVKDPAWNANPIDRFVKAKLEAKSLRAVGLASKAALLRRATYDLTGLPPTPEEMRLFLSDRSANAFEKQVDRLLASAAYGEKWGRHWLDLVRYADTAGCNSDFPVPDAYRYRNWVIQAFKEDKPYDQFLREQLSGDLMNPTNAEDREAKLVATSYIAISRRFASNKNEHHLTIDDTIDNVSKAMLGLTVSCARCHDHKFDAISQRDYYALYGIFQSTKYAFPGVEIFPRPHDFVALKGEKDQEKLSKWESSIVKIHEDISALRFGKRRDEPNKKELIKQLEAESMALEVAPPELSKAYAVQEGESKNARLQFKGDPKKLGEEVPRGWLGLLGGELLPANYQGSGRAKLADWVVAKDNPLMPRVMVNRVWAWHFGQGIAPSLNDFGTRGETPSDPQLLDWLATRFVESGYSVKQLHKRIMLSRTYQLSSDDDAANFAKDAKNAFHWRFDRRRLEAEEIRDSLLAVAGNLDAIPGGAHPFPALHTWRFSQHRQFFADYDHNKRSIYLMQQRLRKNPLLEVFDPADPNASTAQRAGNVTALQALSFMNSSFLHRQADEFAVRVGMASTVTAARIQKAYQLTFGRAATAQEVQDGSAYLAKAERLLTNSEVPLEKQPRTALASYLRVLLSSDEFLFVD
jgi:hypothetical protein